MARKMSFDPSQTTEERLAALEKSVQALSTRDPQDDIRLGRLKNRLYTAGDLSNGSDLLAPGSVQGEHLATDSIGAREIAAGSVTDTELNSPSREEILAQPRPVLYGMSVWSAFMAAIFWMPGMSSGIIAQTTDTNLGVHNVRLDPAELDNITGYKPQMRLHIVIATNTFDPGTQTFDVAVTSLIDIPGTGAGAANNRKYQVSGLFLPLSVTNVSASSAYPLTSAWTDFSAANLTSAGFASSATTYDYVTLAMKPTVAPAGSSLLSCKYTVDIRYIPA